MPHSLRAKLSGLRYKGILEDKDYKRLCHALDLEKAEQEPKTGHCKDCKWWKDSDGAFRRGIGAESKCHLNTDVVYEGLGYCYMFEPKESEG